MIGFGCDNKELCGGIAPFLVMLLDNDEHMLRIIISACVEGEPGEDLDLEEWPESVRENIEGSDELRDMLLSSRPVYASTVDVYEIAIDGYVLFMERDESYTTFDDYELREGTALIRFVRSRLLDVLKTFTFADDDFPGLLTHYGIYCEDHIIDVVTDATPRVRKLEPEGIAALGFGSPSESVESR